uniref:Uncharacterized protein n=1 Tax=Magallana gigas TaxID=29159 RepID=K1Q4L5_MAGGI|eukprot:XP_011450933.1 PREDICTED: uncharacterized protein LOC105344758 [Crassostrea gigas]
MKTGILESLMVWYFCSAVGGKQTLLTDFSYKRPSHAVGGPSTFSAKKLLKQSQLKTKGAASVHDLKIPKVLQSGQTSVDKPDLVKSVRKQDLDNPKTIENLAKPDSIRVNTPQSVENKNMQLINSEVISSQIDQVSSDKVPEKDIQLKTGASDLALFTSAKEAHAKHFRVVDHSSTPIPQLVTSQTDIDLTTPNIVITLGLEHVRTPTPIYEIPICSWIDPNKCPDVSRVQPECLEYPKVDSPYGECKTCPLIISWCFEPNDMAGSGKLHDNSPLDVVLNTRNMKAPKFALAINKPVIL